MRLRWPGRRPAIALVTASLAAAVAVTGSNAAAPDGVQLTVRDASGRALVQLPLLADRAFSLGYRNSVYRSHAEERYAADSDGRLVLTGLAAEELAVLEEYYAIDHPAWRATSGLTWGAHPAQPVVIDELWVAATDLGRRSLRVDGRPPVELWRLVDDSDPMVQLAVEPMP